MEFGHLYDSLDEVDFSLKPDTEITIRTLQKKKDDAELKVFVGASKWAEKSWKGIVYPPKVADNQLLAIYTQNFNTVEFGPSFYNIYNAEQIGRWAEQVTETSDFKFCPKFPQNITHIRRLTNAESQTQQFYESLKGFGNTLGPLLLQLGDNFSPKSFTNLKSFLQSLDPTIKVSIEVRNKSWFADIEHRAALLSLLSGLNIGTVISDTTGRRDAVHMDLTTTDAFIRFVGNNLALSDYKRMDDWVERIKIWADMGLKSLYFFMHQNNEQYVPQACVYFINKLNARLGTNLKAPSFLTL